MASQEKQIDQMKAYNAVSSHPDFIYKSTTTEQRAHRLVDCTKVYVTPSVLGGAGAFAAQPIKKGEVVEYGLMRRVNVDGNRNPFVFTWSEDRTVWAFGGGCLTFYNTHPTAPNCGCTRFFDEDRMEIFALRDIAKDEELTHTYRSLKWRKCFVDSLPQK